MSTTERAYTLTLTLSHPMGQPMSMSIPIDDLMGEHVRFSPRAVNDLKAGLMESMDATVGMMKRRKYRKDLFKEACKRLGALLAERMEDAEGWHDTSRIESARARLGGDWR